MPEAENQIQYDGDTFELPEAPNFNDPKGWLTIARLTFGRTYSESILLKIFENATHVKISGQDSVIFLQRL